MTDQMSLFDPTAEEVAARQAERAAWRTQFRRVMVATGSGETALAYACPDCQGLAVTAYRLHISHGWHPGMPGERPSTPGVCSGMRLVSTQGGERIGTRDEEPCPDCGAAAGDACETRCPAVLRRLRGPSPEIPDPPPVEEVAS